MAPAATDALLFDNIGGFTNGPGLVNNIVDQNTTVSSLQYTAFIGNYHTTEIPTNVTLSLAGTDGTLLSVGTSTDDGADAQIFTTMTGGGNLAVGDMVAPVATTIAQVGQRSGTGGLHRGTLDLTGLNSFTAGVGSFYVGGNWVSINRDQGTLYLAKTNVILAVSTATAGAIRLAHSPATRARGATCTWARKTPFTPVSCESGRAVRNRWRCGAIPDRAGQSDLETPRRRHGQPDGHAQSGRRL